MVFGSEMAMRRTEYGGLLGRPEGVPPPTEVTSQGLRSGGMVGTERAGCMC